MPDGSFVDDDITSESNASESSAQSNASDSSYHSATDIPTFQDEQSFQVPTYICRNQITFVDSNQNLKFKIDCQEEHTTMKEHRAHNKKCLVRNQNKALNDSHQHETASIIWSAMKNNGLASALVKVINEDLMSNSLVECGITKLRSNVGVKNCDLFALKNSSTLHCVKKHEKNTDRRGRDIIQLNSDDIRLIAGTGESINGIAKTVKQLRKQNIPTEKNVVPKIRSERKTIRAMTENIVVDNVQRRTKNQVGSSHLGLV